MTQLQEIQDIINQKHELYYIDTYSIKQKDTQQIKWILRQETNLSTNETSRQLRGYVNDNLVILYYCNNEQESWKRNKGLTMDLYYNIEEAKLGLAKLVENEIAHLKDKLNCDTYLINSLNEVCKTATKHDLSNTTEYIKEIEARIAIKEAQLTDLINKQQSL